MHAVPFKLTLVCMGEYMPLGNSWVSCVNERMLLSDLCRQYGGVWGDNLLKQTPYDLRSVIVSERIAIDFDELRAMETARLEALAANAVFSNMIALTMLRLHVGHLTDGVLPLPGSAAFTCDALGQYGQ